MTEIKRHPRRTRTDENLEATRRQVVDAARRLFLERGYGGTTVGEVALAAGVAVQTIYNAVGGKPALLTRVFEAQAAGPAAPRTVPETMRERTRAVPDAAGVVALLADWFGEVNARLATLWQVIDEAAATDAEVARFARARALLRLQHYGEAARALRERGAGAHLEEGDVAALLFAVGHPRAYRTLVEEHGWTLARYRRWAEATLAAALLGSPARRRRGPTSRAPGPGPAARGRRRGARPAPGSA